MGEAEALEEMIQQFQVFSCKEVEITSWTARQVALVDLADQDGMNFVSQALADAHMGQEWDDDTNDELGREGQPDVKNEAQQILKLVQARKEKGLSTLLKDILTDVEGQAAMRRGIDTVRKQKARERLRELQRGHGEGSPEIEKGKGAYECLVDAQILTRKVPVIVDTGASTSIVSLRTIKKLRLKSLIRPSKKAFITARGSYLFQWAKSWPYH